MLALLLNLGFAGGGTVTTSNAGSFNTTDRNWRRTQRRLAIQQGLLKDDEEVLALLLATMYRN